MFIIVCYFILITLIILFTNRLFISIKKINPALHFIPFFFFYKQLADSSGVTWACVNNLK